MTNATVGRFHLLEHNQLQLPHKCGTCGAFSGAKGRKFIDFDMWIEFYGVVYICNECFLGAAKELDCVPTVQYDEAMRQVEEYKAVVLSLIAENRGLRDAVDNLRGFDRPDPSSLVVYESVYQELESGSVGSEVQHEESSGDLSGGDPEPEKTESEPVRQTDVRGPENVRSNVDYLTKPDTSLSDIGLTI